MESQATILVVDDSPENLQVISAVLKEHYKVKVAINGERALALATAAGAYIRIEGDNIELGAPGKVEFKGTQREWADAASEACEVDISAGQLGGCEFKDNAG